MPAFFKKKDQFKLKFIPFLVLVKYSSALTMGLSIIVLRTNIQERKKANA